jgi:ABC-type branched-subunit amino acid transport system ATPase component
VYCLEAGAVIAEGTPNAVRNDPRVVASYLGTDERAIQRSNATA